MASSTTRRASPSTLGQRLRRRLRKQPDPEVPASATPPDTTINSGPIGRDQRPDPDLHLLLLGGGLDLRVQGRLGRLCAPAAHRRPPAHLTDGSHTFYVRATDPAGNTDPDAGLAHLHGPNRRGQRLGLDARGHRRAGSQGQPRDHPALGLDPAGDRLPRRRLHGLRRPHRAPGCTRSGDYTANCSASRDHPDPGHLRRSDRPGGQLDRDQELAQRRGGERHADRRLGQRHPDRGDRAPT